MISHKHKFIFIHIPKTGGTSIESIFKEGVGGPWEGPRGVKHKHASAIEMKKIYPNEWSNFFKFGFVRNPYCLLVSRYHWSRNLQNISWYNKHTFKEFILNLDIKRGIISPSWTIPIPQYNYLSIGPKLNIDFTGRFENLQQDFDVICQKIGIAKQKLPCINKSKHKHYTEYYDDETRQIVAEKYAKDIEYFGYKFGD